MLAKELKAFVLAMGVVLLVVLAVLLYGFVTVITQPDEAHILARWEAGQFDEAVQVLWAHREAFKQRDWDRGSSEVLPTGLNDFAREYMGEEFPALEKLAKQEAFEAVKLVEEGDGELIRLEFVARYDKVWQQRLLLYYTEDERWTPETAQREGLSQLSPRWYKAAGGITPTPWTGLFYWEE